MHTQLADTTADELDRGLQLFLELCGREPTTPGVRRRGAVSSPYDAVAGDCDGDSLRTVQLQRQVAQNEVATWSRPPPPMLVRPSPPLR